MSKKRYDDILLISDLDGTLIPRYEGISEENLQALNAFPACVPSQRQKLLPPP